MRRRTGIWRALASVGPEWTDDNRGTVSGRRAVPDLLALEGTSSSPLARRAQDGTAE